MIGKNCNQITFLHSKCELTGPPPPPPLPPPSFLPPSPSSSSLLPPSFLLFLFSFFSFSSFFSFLFSQSLVLPSSRSTTHTIVKGHRGNEDRMRNIQQIKLNCLHCPSASDSVVTPSILLSPDTSSVSHVLNNISSSSSSCEEQRGTWMSRSISDLQS